MNDRVSRLIEQRLLRRHFIAMLAEPLEGEARETFIATAEADLNATLPAPGRHHMRMYLKVVD